MRSLLASSRIRFICAVKFSRSEKSRPLICSATRFCTDLKITDEQTTELKETEKEIEEELEREIAKLRKESREKLLGKLKRSQREEVKELFGETFDFGKRKRTPNKQRQKK